MSSIIGIAFSGAEQVVKQACELGGKWIPAQKYEFLANLPECNVENVASYAPYIGVAALALYVGYSMIKHSRKIDNEHQEAMERIRAEISAAEAPVAGIAVEAPAAGIAEEAPAAEAPAREAPPVNLAVAREIKDLFKNRYFASHIESELIKTMLDLPIERQEPVRQELPEALSDVKYWSVVHVAVKLRKEFGVPKDLADKIILEFYHQNIGSEKEVILSRIQTAFEAYKRIGDDEFKDAEERYEIEQ